MTEQLRNIEARALRSLDLQPQKRCIVYEVAGYQWRSIILISAPETPLDVNHLLKMKG